MSNLEAASRDNSVDVLGQSSPRMSRPILLQLLPPSLRQRVWSRFYRPTPPRLLGLFESAPLHFAPSMRMKLIPGDVISDSIALTGIYELAFTQWLVNVARREGGVLVDVGANLGYFSVLWCAQNNRNCAVAFEGSPRNISSLDHNIRINGLQDRIAMHAQAVGRSRGTIHFDLGPEDQTGWGCFASEATATTISVDVMPLDEMVVGVPEISVLKIDIEGADGWALQGAERAFRERRVRHVWWEENKARMQQLGIPSGEAQTFMRSVGYEPVSQGDPAAGLVNWYATPRT